MITPHEKPPSGELSEAAEEADKGVNRIRRAGRCGQSPTSSPGESSARPTGAPARIRADHHRRTRALLFKTAPRISFQTR